MSKIVGTVSEVKEFKTARGTMYSITVNGNFYGTGSVNPKCGKGDTVAFTFTENGKYKNIDMKTFSIEAGAPPSGGLTGGSTGGSYGDRQEIISRQSALNSSIAFVNLLIAADALPGTTKTSKADDKYGIIEALVNEKAAEFLATNTGKDAPDAAEPLTQEAPKDKNWT